MEHKRSQHRPAKVSALEERGNPSHDPRPAQGQAAEAVQLLARRPTPGGAAQVQEAAQRGVQGKGQQLPHTERIQNAFGAHSLAGVEAHVGGRADDACQSLGAQAYATGNKVAFSAQPSLHTAAHEAAHVVQQRAGVSLRDNVGKAGDRYEQQADRVADAVVQGRSAEPLLDGLGAPIYGLSSSMVQRLAVQFAGSAGEFVTQASLDSHFEKHVENQQDAGGTYADADAYEAAAMAVVSNHDETKTVGNTTYYWKSSTSQFVAVRGGTIRTMFVPTAGKAYYDAK